MRWFEIWIVTYIVGFRLDAEFPVTIWEGTASLDETISFAQRRRAVHRASMANTHTSELRGTVWGIVSSSEMALHSVEQVLGCIDYQFQTARFLRATVWSLFRHIAGVRL